MRFSVKRGRDELLLGYLDGNDIGTDSLIFRVGEVPQIPDSLKS
jgi:hypothetical protein